ncbi:hypothetical protein FRC01_012071, partial [Tulasnella sp. 417]
MAELAPSEASPVPRSSQTVAVKKLQFGYEDTEIFKAFVYELSLLATLSHPNVIELIGFVEDIEAYDARMILPWEANGNVREFLQSGEWDVPERVSLVGD